MSLFTFSTAVLAPLPGASGLLTHASRPEPAAATPPAPPHAMDDNTASAAPSLLLAGGG